MTDQGATPGRSQTVQEDESFGRRSYPGPDLTAENETHIPEVWNLMQLSWDGGREMFMGAQADSGNKFGLVE
jgi:hypothetical protein